MIDHFDASIDRAVSFPRAADDVGKESWLSERAVAQAWLLAQEEALAEVFLAEGRRDLPVEDYPSWLGEQQHRLGRARESWQRMLLGAGWPLGSEGSRSLAYLRPDLMGEYDSASEDNPADLPYRGTLASTVSVWWSCSRDEEHRWRTSFYNRHVVGTGCPRCAKRGVSRRELEIFTALRQSLPDLTSPATVPRAAAAPRQRQQRAWRVDMYLPGAPPVVVEYDGAYWHQDREGKDSAKSADLAASGHIVVRIRESPLPAVTCNDVACTAEMPAAEVAHLVLQRISALTRSPAAMTRPPAENPPDVVPSTPRKRAERPVAATADLDPFKRNLIASWSLQALLASHRAGVVADLGTGYLGGLSPDVVQRAQAEMMKEVGTVKGLTLAVTDLLRDSQSRPPRTGSEGRAPKPACGALTETGGLE
ncbi:zinc-ribbon domain-containing protein (plasmid) [Streptomyces nojiriensis]|uniref:zinc-ribbon domain-containing protein n=1 Tax=Streptomyces nojiriensis TaxID=66374 RepID=UPI002E17125B